MMKVHTHCNVYPPRISWRIGSARPISYRIENDPLRRHERRSDRSGNNRQGGSRNDDRVRVTLQHAAARQPIDNGSARPRQPCAIYNLAANRRSNMPIPMFLLILIAPCVPLVVTTTLKVAGKVFASVTISHARVFVSHQVSEVSATPRVPDTHVHGHDRECECYITDARTGSVDARNGGAHP